MGASVTIIPPKNWWGHARFRLNEPICLLGASVPAGFVTDGATIPRWAILVGLCIVGIANHYDSTFWITIGALTTATPAVFPKINRYFESAVVHDYMTRRGAPVSRWVADNHFRKCLMHQGVARWRADLMYTVVSIASVGFIARKKMLKTWGLR